MGETETHTFYDFGIFEPVTKPHTQLILSLETQGHLTKIKNKRNTFIKHISFINLGFLKLQCLTFFQKTGTDK